MYILFSNPDGEKIGTKELNLQFAKLTPCNIL